MEIPVAIIHDMEEKPAIQGRKLHAVVVDDEPLARMHLRHHLQAQGVDVIGEAENAIGALELSESLKPDLLFLDIQMPGLNGMQLASALLHLEPAPLIVFATGYSEHAVTAYENDSLDYLVKPIAPERLAKTLVRARQRLVDRHARRLATSKIKTRAKEAAPLSRLPVRGDYCVKLVRIEDIEYAYAKEKRVFVRTPDGEHRTYYTLIQLEALLPKDRFGRVHDSYIVNLNLVEELLFLGNHEYEVRLTSGQRLPVGRTRYTALRQMLGLTTNVD